MGTNYTGTQLRTTYRKEFLEFLVSELKIISDLMAKRSVYFHATPKLTLADGTHVILRHTPKSEQKMLMYSPFWNKAKTMVMPEVVFITTVARRYVTIMPVMLHRQVPMYWGI